MGSLLFISVPFILSIPSISKANFLGELPIVELGLFYVLPGVHVPSHLMVHIGSGNIEVGLVWIVHESVRKIVQGIYPALHFDVSHSPVIEEFRVFGVGANGCVVPSEESLWLFGTDFVEIIFVQMKAFADALFFERWLFDRFFQDAVEVQISVVLFTSQVIFESR